jgi:hypothetical protein
MIKSPKNGPRIVDYIAEKRGPKVVPVNTATGQDMDEGNNRADEVELISR